MNYGVKIFNDALNFEDGCETNLTGMAEVGKRVGRISGAYST